MTKQRPDPSARYVYVLVRCDLPFPQQAVQAAHAAMISARQHVPSDFTDTPNLVLLGVPDGITLHQAHEHLVRNRIPCSPYFEPDYGNEMTAVATGLLFGDQRKHLRIYRLLG